LIFDHLLWPLERIALEARERRHWAHITDLSGFDRGVRLDNDDGEKSEGIFRRARQRLDRAFTLEELTAKDLYYTLRKLQNLKV
jgi:hypothetical protein